jgi:predicted nucleic acid-binding protein
VSDALYLDTSVVLRATLEAGLEPAVEEKIAGAGLIMTSRLTLVEASRVLIRVRLARTVPEKRVADVEREIDAILSRCEILELTPTVCELAARVAPRIGLRALDALHLATFVKARRRLENLELFTADVRLREAAEAG